MLELSPIVIPRNLKFKYNYYISYSIKIKRNVKVFKDLNYNNFILLEFNPDVINFCEYPTKINIEIDGKYEEVIFDMYVEYKSGIKEFQLIIGNDFIEDKNNYQRRTTKLEQWCYKSGYNFKIISDKDLYIGKYYTNNLRCLLGLIKRQDIPLLKRYLKMLCSELCDNKIKIKEIMDINIIPFNYVYATIALGIYNGIIIASIKDKIISYDTEVWLNND